MHFHIVTIFPQVFSEYLKTSIIGRAIKEKNLKVTFYNPIDFLEKKERLDDRPFGGGPGMVLRIEPFLKAIKKAIGRKKDVSVYVFDVDGAQFTNKTAKSFSKKKDVVLVCGHYEGIDSRLKKMFKAKSLSVGKDFVLTGGELPAQLVIDASARQIDNVLRNTESVEENRISNSEVYTRPSVFVYKNKEYKVPKVLLSGNHKEIDKWKLNCK